MTNEGNHERHKIPIHDEPQRTQRNAENVPFSAFLCELCGQIKQHIIRDSTLSLLRYAWFSYLRDNGENRDRHSPLLSLFAPVKAFRLKSVFLPCSIREL